MAGKKLAKGCDYAQSDDGEPASADRASTVDQGFRGLRGGPRARPLP